MNEYVEGIQFLWMIAKLCFVRLRVKGIQVDYASCRVAERPAVNKTKQGQ